MFIESSHKNIKSRHKQNNTHSNESTNQMQQLITGLSFVV